VEEQTGLNWCVLINVMEQNCQTGFNHKIQAENEMGITLKLRKTSKTYIYKKLTADILLIFQVFTVPMG